MRKGPETRWPYRLPSHISKDGAFYRQCWWGYTYRVANVSPGSCNEEYRSDMYRFTAQGHSGAEPHATTRNP